MGAESLKTILLVEDDELLAMVEKEILENFGYRAVIATSGEEAVEIVGKTPAIDLVLMDINLGAGIDGTEAALRILRDRDLPVIFLSSYTEPEIVEKTEKITSYGYVVKGSGPTVLQASIKMAFKLFEAKTKEMEKEAKMEAALAALRESEKKYRMLVENINDVIFTIDAAGKFTYVSPVIEQLSGLKPDDILGRSFVDFVHPDDLPGLAEKFRQTMGGARESFEFRVVNGDEIRHVMTSSQRFVRDGVVTGITGIMSDISERKRSEELLRASEERYRQLVENTDTGLVVIDDQGIVISANESYLRIAGAERFADVIGHSVTEWTAADEKENNARAVQLCVTQGFIQDFETVYQHADGTRIDVIINATVEKNPNGGEHIASLCRDISERKRAELKLAEERKLLEFILGATQTGIDILDADFNLSYVDLAWQKVYGDPQGRKCYEYFMGHSEPCPGCGVLHAAKTREIVVSEEFLPRENRFIEVHTIPFQDENGKCLFAEINIDITRRKEAQEEIKQQLLEKEILLREAHHRIRNNLASIGGILFLHLKSISNPEAIAVLQDAISRVNSMETLYDILLRSEDYTDVSVNRYVEGLATTVIALFPGNAKVTLEPHVDDFRLDPKRLFPLGIIINELLTNKMKYAFSKRITGVITIYLTLIKNRVTLTIWDDGTGLPEGFDVDKTKGYGLTLVKMLSKQLRGSFSIENSKGTPCKLEFDM